jgi:hypothetical protein
MIIAIERREAEIRTMLPKKLKHNKEPFMPG